MKIIGEIPARYGSKRVKNKNLRLINGQPLISYAIEAAKGSKLLDEIHVNTESEEIGKLAQDTGVSFYKRSDYLASDEAKQEEFNADFIENTNADVLVMVNPVSPLIEAEDIDKVIQYYLDNDFDTVVTTEALKQQAFYKGDPINININGLLQPTQELEPIHLCAWSITIWNAKSFMKQYNELGYASFAGKVGFYPINRLKCIKISYEEDFQLAERILESRKHIPNEPSYYNR